jgi:hypothetical protein
MFLLTIWLSASKTSFKSSISNFFETISQNLLQNQFFCNKSKKLFKYQKTVSLSKNLSQNKERKI